jgi:hypothetical protein
VPASTFSGLSQQSQNIVIKRLQRLSASHFHLCHKQAVLAVVQLVGEFSRLSAFLDFEPAGVEALSKAS